MEIPARLYERLMEGIGDGIAQALTRKGRELPDLSGNVAAPSIPAEPGEYEKHSKDWFGIMDHVVPYAGGIRKSPDCEGLPEMTASLLRKIGKCPETLAGDAEALASSPAVRTSAVRFCAAQGLRERDRATGLVRVSRETKFMIREFPDILRGFYVPRDRKEFRQFAWNFRGFLPEDIIDPASPFSFRISVISESGEKIPARQWRKGERGRFICVEWGDAVPIVLSTGCVGQIGHGLAWQTDCEAIAVARGKEIAQVEAESDLDGAGNTDAILGMAGGKAGRVPAMEHAVSVTEDFMGREIRGYLPSLGQLTVLGDLKNTVNAAIAAAGGERIPFDRLGLWSSNEMSGFSAWLLFNGVVSRDDKVRGSHCSLPLFRPDDVLR